MIKIMVTILIQSESELLLKSDLETELKLQSEG